MQRASNTQDLFSHEPAGNEGMGNRICRVMRVAPGTRKAVGEKKIGAGGGKAEWQRVDSRSRQD